MQLSLLRDTDGEKTKLAVEQELERYRMYLLIVDDERLPKITTTFSITPPTFSNQFHSSTEDIAIERVDQERERERFMQRIERAVNRLAAKEREIIIKQYLNLENPSAAELYDECNMSKSSYYRCREQAFYKLAFALKIAVYKTPAHCG